jgi:hypothetical protein
MMKKLFALVLLCAFSVPAWADKDHGFYVGVLVGKTSNIANIDSANFPNIDSLPSAGVLAGYQFNSFLAIEGAGISLIDKAQSQNSNTTTTNTTGATVSRSISGAELAGVVALPVTEGFSVLARLGYANLSSTETTTNSSNNNGGNNSTSPTEVEISWKGPMYGLGMQYLFDFHSKMRMGLRVGFDRYVLKDPTGLLTETPTNAYLAGMLMF